MFDYYQDPGHGWLCVTLEDIRNAGLKPSAFSAYSYRRRNQRETVMFLEEDCDMPKFIQAYETAHRVPCPIREVIIDDRRQIGL